MRIALALVAVLSAVAPATWAANLPFEGTLAISGPYAFGSELASFTIGGTGVATVNGSGGGGHLSAWTVPASAFATAGAVMPVTDPAQFPIMGIQLTVQNGAGSFSGVGGPMPLLGVQKICVFAPCSTPPPLNVSIPLSVVGAGGAKTISFSVMITVTGSPWTTAAVTAGNLPPIAGFRHGRASGTSSTAAASGAVRLVTPFTVSTNISGAPFLPGYALLTLHFVPEPTTFALLAGGFAALGAGGRALRRKGAPAER